VPGALDRQRIDRWLWHARLIRTRGGAAELAAGGAVRVNGVRIEAPGRMVRVGDVITVAFERSVRVLKVTGFRERRGPPGSGDKLYQELTELQVRIAPLEADGCGTSLKKGTSLARR
jgi:ribosome-associated heat shock protein Hsp15